MADETKKGKAAEAAQRPGFDESGKPYPGFNAETGEWGTVTLDAFKDRYGPKTGAEMFRRVAQAAGGGNSLVPVRVEDYPGGIGLAGADKDVIEKVNAILSGKE